MSASGDALLGMGTAQEKGPRRAEYWPHGGGVLGRGQSEQTELGTAAPLWGEEDEGSKSRTLSQEVVRGRRKDGRGWTLNIACSVWESPPPPHHPTWDSVSGKTERWRMHVRDGERDGFCFLPAKQERRS